eukprot:jgi/Mesen1/682/ME000109S_10905
MATPLKSGSRKKKHATLRRGEGGSAYTKCPGCAISVAAALLSFHQNECKLFIASASAAEESRSAHDFTEEIEDAPIRGERSPRPSQLPNLPTAADGIATHRSGIPTYTNSSPEKSQDGTPGPLLSEAEQPVPQREDNNSVVPSKKDVISDARGTQKSDQPRLEDLHAEGEGAPQTTFNALRKELEGVRSSERQLREVLVLLRSKHLSVCAQLASQVEAAQTSQDDLEVAWGEIDIMKAEMGNLRAELERAEAAREKERAGRARLEEGLKALCHLEEVRQLVAGMLRWQRKGEAEEGEAEKFTLRACPEATEALHPPPARRGEVAGAQTSLSPPGGHLGGVSEQENDRSREVQLGRAPAELIVGQGLGEEGVEQDVHASATEGGKMGDSFRLVVGLGLEVGVGVGAGQGCPDGEGAQQVKLEGVLPEQETTIGASGKPVAEEAGSPKEAERGRREADAREEPCRSGATWRNRGVSAEAGDGEGVAGKPDAEAARGAGMDDGGGAREELPVAFKRRRRGGQPATPRALQEAPDACAKRSLFESQQGGEGAEGGKGPGEDAQEERRAGGERAKPGVDDEEWDGSSCSGGEREREGEGEGERSERWVEGSGVLHCSKPWKRLRLSQPAARQPDAADLRKDQQVHLNVQVPAPEGRTDEGVVAEGGATGRHSPGGEEEKVGMKSQSCGDQAERKAGEEEAEEEEWEMEEEERNGEVEEAEEEKEEEVEGSEGMGDFIVEEEEDEDEEAVMEVGEEEEVGGAETEGLSEGGEGRLGESGEEPGFGKSSVAGGGELGEGGAGGEGGAEGGSGEEYRWQLEGDVLAALGKDDTLCLRAVCALFRQQTAGERLVKASKVLNGRGFRTAHARRASAIALFLLGGDPDAALGKTTGELARCKGQRELEFCRHVAFTYSKQLFRLYQRREDKHFPWR